jgi:hypothetical protein
MERVMDTQAEMQRENEVFEAGVKAYYNYIDAETDTEENASYEVWAEWTRHHPEMSVDAQSSARLRWKRENHQ